MEVIVYLVLGLSIWILVPSERSALVGRVADRTAQGEQRPPADDDADEASADLVVVSRDR
jgi:hypothetical protein